MQELADTLRILGDETRLRILRLLMEESLNVGELTRILGIAQPTVSKHLGELRKAGFVENSRRGGFSYYQLEDFDDELWRAFSSRLSSLYSGRGDLPRLAEILKQRTEYSEADRFVVPGRSWVVWSRALRYLLPPQIVADFGCGDGAFTVEIATWAKRVYAIDSNPAFLRLAQKAARNFPNIRFLQESMEEVSLAKQSVDLVVVSQSLHYVEDPQATIAEAFRILKCGGRFLLIELLPHDEEWVVAELGHRWLGFDPQAIQEWLQSAGFRQRELDLNFKRASNSFQPFLATAAKGDYEN